MRQTEGGGVADGDILIYEVQGFSLTTLSFTETQEEERNLDRNQVEVGGPKNATWREK